MSVGQKKGVGWGKKSKNANRVDSFIWQSTYPDLPNNRAANFIIFRGKKTYTTLLGPTRSLISEIFFQNLIFTYINEKKPYLHSLIRTYTFINLSEICLLHD